MEPSTYYRVVLGWILNTSIVLQMGKAKFIFVHDHSQKFWFTACLLLYLRNYKIWILLVYFLRLCETLVKQHAGCQSQAQNYIHFSWIMISGTRLLWATFSFSHFFEPKLHKGILNFCLICIFWKKLLPFIICSNFLELVSMQYISSDIIGSCKYFSGRIWLAWGGMGVGKL